ncbi:AMP-binding enzyme [Micromonospora craniellae]|nr:hypothetical protein [Micromonospora craniellae]
MPRCRQTGVGQSTALPTARGRPTAPIARHRATVLVGVPSMVQSWSRAVESVLSAHPAVAESAVVGVPHPRTGETVRAYVVPVAGYRATGAELIAHCARNLARFKCPTDVEFVDLLPRSLIGKVRKTLLRPTGTTEETDA